ncbi:MAG: hypothetical protein JWP61_306 [Friedmanniella sp.]|nr:hypothetical protein [Friedmanniella sp.]
MSQQRWGSANRFGSPGGPAYPAYGQPSGRGSGPGFGGLGGIPQYGPGPSMPGPRRRNPLRSLLGLLVVIALVAVGGLIVANLSAPTSQTAYENNDYQVPPPDTSPPPIPIPETYDEAQRWVTRSAFYAEQTPSPVDCTADPINVGTASDARLKAHYESLMECLMRVWEPPVTGASYQIVRPTVTIYGSKIATRCGTTGVNAFYCAADQQVYYSNRLADAVPIVRQDKWAADVVMAHEFGHALQARTGILIAAKALGQNSGSESTDLQYSRRLETQADCLSAMFIRSVTASLKIQPGDTQGILDTYAAVGDDEVSGNSAIVGNHGLARSRQYWGNTGLNTGAIEACNTFVAKSSLVR